MFRSLSAKQEQSFTRSCTITSILEVLKLVLARSNDKSIIHVKINVSRGFLWAKLKIFVEPSPSVPPWLVWYLLKNSIFYVLYTPIPKQLKLSGAFWLPHKGALKTLKTYMIEFFAKIAKSC